MEFWEGTSVKSYKIQLSVLLILVLHLFLYQQISFFCNFLELHSTLYEKDFCCKLFFLNGFTQISLIAKSAKRDKTFESISLKCLTKYFFQRFVGKILQKHLFCINSELLLYIYFKGSNYRFSGVLFLTAIWLPHDQLWAILKGAALLTHC